MAILSSLLGPCYKPAILLTHSFTHTVKRLRAKLKHRPFANHFMFFFFFLQGPSRDLFGSSGAGTVTSPRRDPIWVFKTRVNEMLHCRAGFTTHKVLVILVHAWVERNDIIKHLHSKNGTAACHMQSLWFMWTHAPYVHAFLRLHFSANACIYKLYTPMTRGIKQYQTCCLQSMLANLNCSFFSQYLPNSNTKKQ